MSMQIRRIHRLTKPPMQPADHNFVPPQNSAGTITIFKPELLAAEPASPPADVVRFTEEVPACPGALDTAVLDDVICADDGRTSPSPTVQPAGPRTRDRCGEDSSLVSVNHLFCCCCSRCC